MRMRMNLISEHRKGTQKRISLHENFFSRQPVVCTVYTPFKEKDEKFWYFFSTVFLRRAYNYVETFDERGKAQFLGDYATRPYISLKRTLKQRRYFYANVNYFKISMIKI